MIQKEFKTSPDNPVYMKKIKDAQKAEEKAKEKYLKKKVQNQQKNINYHFLKPQQNQEKMQMKFLKHYIKK